MNSRAEPLAHTNDDYSRPTKPLTLAIDIGGSHLKAAVLKASGKISMGPLRVESNFVNSAASVFGYDGENSEP